MDIPIGDDELAHVSRLSAELNRYEVVPGSKARSGGLVQNLSLNFPTRLRKLLRLQGLDVEALLLWEVPQHQSKV